MLAIIQARLSSKRLPGKVLLNLYNKPIIDWIVSRINLSKLISNFIIATSIDPSDDILVDYCNLKKYQFYRGPLDNVAQRLLDAMNSLNCNEFLRINGDSPLIDPEILDFGLQKYMSGNFDLVTNVQNRSYPSGQSVEIIRGDNFRMVNKLISTSDDKEHVTRFYYKNSSLFKINNFSSREYYGNLKMSVDTINDFIFIDKLIKLSKGQPGNLNYLINKMKEIN